MSEERIASVMHEFVDAFNKNDVERAVSYFQDDASYQAVEGTFKGKSEIKRYLAWGTQMTSNPKITETGIGLLVKGNTAVHEHNLEGTYEGKNFVTHGVFVVEFKGERMQNAVAVHDRLSLAKQAAKGWMATRAVNSIVNAMEKGLH